MKLGRGRVRECVGLVMASTGGPTQRLSSLHQQNFAESASALIDGMNVPFYGGTSNRHRDAHKIQQ